MVLFKSNDNKKLLKDIMRNAQTKKIECPKCHKRYTVTFLGSDDYKTCICGRRIYGNKI